jgi:hypothetical protein
VLVLVRVRVRALALELLVLVVMEWRRMASPLCWMTRRWRLVW